MSLVVCDLREVISLFLFIYFRCGCAHAYVNHSPYMEIRAQLEESVEGPRD